MVLWLAAALLAASLAGFDMRWAVALGAPPSAPPSFDDDTCYVPLRGGTLAAIELRRGARRWQRTIDTAMTPAIGDGLVFVATADGVEAIAAASGRTVWRQPLAAALVTLTWDTGWLLGSSGDGELLAARARDGEVIWRTALGARLTHPPAAGLDRVYVALASGQVVSLRLATGEVAWTRPVPGGVTSLHAVDGQLIVGTSGRAALSLDLATGRQRWRWRIGGDVVGPAAADARHVYFVARDNVLRAVDLRNGNLRWSADLPSRPVGGPRRLGEAVIVPLATAVAAFEVSTGKSAGTLAISGEMSAAPHLRQPHRPSEPQVVAVTRDGRLQAFAPRLEPPPVALSTLPGVSVVP